MQQNNSIQKQENPKDKYSIVTKSGETINLSLENVQKYLCNGAPITASEFTMFFQLCKEYKVNPFLKEAYIIKYGSSPATIVLDYKVLQQIADSNPQYNGMKTGLIVIDKDGNEKERTGGYVLPNEQIIAGWCEVFRKDRKESTKAYAMFDEFKQVTKSGELNSIWKTKGAFMIIKVAKAQALREAFPNSFASNVYSTDEINVNEKKNNDDYIDVTPEDVETRVNQGINNAKEVVNAFDFNEQSNNQSYNQHNDNFDSFDYEEEYNSYDFEENN